MVGPADPPLGCTYRPRIHEQKNSKVLNGSIRYEKQTKVLTHATHVNGWFPAVHMSCMRVIPCQTANEWTRPPSILMKFGTVVAPSE